MHETTGSQEGHHDWYDSSAPRMSLHLVDERGDDRRERKASGSRRWARSRVDTPLHPPRTRPIFSGEFPSIRISELRRQSAHALVLYAVSGAAAMALGIYSSNALVPNFESPITQPALSRDSEWREDAPVRSRSLRPFEADTRRPTRKQAPMAGRRLAAARPTGAKTYAHTTAPASLDTSAEPDMDLMDIPSSPMEQRALAERGRAAVSGEPSEGTNRRKNSDFETAEALSKLDLIRDSGSATSTIHLNSRPWAHVFIDDRSVGTTPLLKQPITAGQHRVRFVNNIFGMTKTIDVTVAAGEHVTRVVSLEE